MMKRLAVILLLLAGHGPALAQTGSCWPDAEGTRVNCGVAQGYVTSGGVWLPVTTTNKLPVTASDSVVYAYPSALTINGATPAKYLSAASTNSTNVKASGGNVYGIAAFNTTATTYYLKFYDKATAPTCNSDTPLLTVPVTSSGGRAEIQPPVGINFTSGIGFCLTGGIGDTDNTNAAAGVAVNVIYK